MPRLTVVAPDGEELAFEFQEGPVTIGRSEDNTVHLDDPDVAPRHCQIERTPEGRYKIVDLETPGGTEVNEQKVNAHLLQHNDRIFVGPWSMLFEETPPRTRRFHLRPRRRGRASPRLRPSDPEATVEFEELAVFTPDAPTPPNHARIMEINKLINSEHNLTKLLELIMDSVIEITAAERGFLILSEGGARVVKVARNIDRESIRKPSFKVSDSIAEEVIREGRPIISADAMSDPALRAAVSVADLKLRSVLCMPFRGRDRILGCVYIDNRFETGVFGEEHLLLLQAFADQAAIAIENARLFEENHLREEQLQRSKEEIERLNSELRNKVERQYAELSKVKRDLDSTRKDVPLRHDFSLIIGKSRAMKDVLALLDRVIDTDEPAYVYGQSGTGKELVARAIHFNSPRARAGRFVSENCSAIPDTLLESELFGHERGAFTGATASKPGLFELAHKGTLFLDEIGDMSVDMQKKVLRALQEGEIRRVGGNELLRVDVRLITASNKDLKELIRLGQFREDLYYRLNVVTILLPPLRDRRDDIPALVDHFLRRIAQEQKQPVRTLDDSALQLLQRHAWPGNVRELENELRRAVALSDGVITVDVLKEEIRDQSLFKHGVQMAPGSALKDVVRDAVEEVERRVITKALEECKWKKSEAARVLGISRPTLDAKIDAYGLVQD